MIAPAAFYRKHLTAEYPDILILGSMNRAVCYSLKYYTLTTKRFIIEGTYPAVCGARGVHPDVLALVIDRSELLNEALDLVRAPHRIRGGVAAAYDEENGRPVVIVAREAGERLEAVRALWLGLVAAARGE